jgi:hypothetical protein
VTGPSTPTRSGTDEPFSLSVPAPAARHAAIALAQLRRATKWYSKDITAGKRGHVENIQITYSLPDYQ